jgi:small GTP-binding protein
MAKIFWYDIYRILYISKRESQYRLLENLSTKFTNLFTRRHYVSAKNIFVKKTCPSQMYSDEWEFQQQKLIRVLIVGTMSSGKSTLINAIAGRKIAKVKTTVCTTAVSHFYNRPDGDEIILSDGCSSVYMNEGTKDKIYNSMVGLKFSGSLKDKPVVLMDTPGINYAYDARHREITQKAIASRDYDIIICVVNSAYLESEESQSVVELVSKVKNKKKIFVLNQLDRFDPEDDSIEESIIQFKSVLNKMKTAAYIAPLSARAALLFKLFRKEENLSNSEKNELLEYSRKMANSYYDLGAYANHKPSIENDYEARTGLTYLETIIVNDEDSKN